MYLEGESPVSAAFLNDFLAWRSSGIRVTQCFTSETPGTPPNVEVSTVPGDARAHEVSGTNVSPGGGKLAMWSGRVLFSSIMSATTVAGICEPLGYMRCLTYSTIVATMASEVGTSAGVWGGACWAVKHRGLGAVLETYHSVPKV